MFSPDASSLALSNKNSCHSVSTAELITLLAFSSLTAFGKIVPFTSRFSSLHVIELKYQSIIRKYIPVEWDVLFLLSTILYD